MAPITGVSAASESYRPVRSEVIEQKTYPDKQIRDLVPLTKEKLVEMRDEQIRVIDSKEAQLRKQFEDNASISAIIQTWNDVNASTQVCGSTLWVTGDKAIQDGDEISKQDTQNVSEAIAKAFDSAFQNDRFKEAFVTYANKQLTKNNQLKPVEWHYLYRIAQGYGYKDLATKLKAQGTQDFSFYESNAPAKEHPINGHFTTLSGNIIFMPANYTYYFGGIQPWKERVDGVANKILQQDADVVSLQEVFDEKSAQALIERLKDKYRYFYYNIGPNYFGHNAPKEPGIAAKNLGVNSGLFIASKYPLDKPEFIPFNVADMQWQVNKGFFVANVKNADGKVIARVISTHLQPFNDDNGRAVRKAEIEAIIDYIDNHPIDAPTLFEGDLNVVFGKRTFDGEEVNEYADSPIPDAFIDLAHNEAVTDDSYTCTDIFEDAVYSRAPSEPFIYDYVLLLKGDESKIGPTRVSLVPMHNKRDLTEQPLSDHHLQVMDTTLRTP